MLGSLVYRYKYMFVTKHNTLKNGIKHVEYWVYNKLNNNRVKVQGGGAYSMCKQLCKMVTQTESVSEDPWINTLIKKLRGEENC